MRAYLEAQGSLLTMKILGVKSRPKQTSPKRGRIKGFSYKSRLRLLRFMARLKVKGVRATFITLTFKGYPSNEEAKTALHAFLQVVGRNFKQAALVWRMEYQRRGSIHFHLLAFNLPYWKWQNILSTWKRITSQSVARVDVRLVRSRRGVMNYVSKYIAKVQKRRAKTFFISVPYLHVGRKWRKGRYWGYHNKKALPLGEKVAGVLTDEKGIKRLAASAWNIIGQETRFGSISFNLFVDHAVSLATRNIEKCGLFLDEWRWSQQVSDREYDDSDYITKHFSKHDFELDDRRAIKTKSRASEASSSTLDLKSWLELPSLLNRASGELTKRPRPC